MKPRPLPLTVLTRKGENHEHSLARPALRGADVAEEAWLYFDRYYHARVGDRGERGHFQRRQRGYTQPLPLSRSRASFSRPAEPAEDRRLGSIARLRAGIRRLC